MLEKKLRANALAGLLGVSEVSVSRWRRGQVVPGRAHTELMAKALGVSAAWLATGEETETGPPVEPANPENALNSEENFYRLLRMAPVETVRKLAEEMAQGPHGPAGAMLVLQHKMHLMEHPEDLPLLISQAKATRLAAEAEAKAAAERLEQGSS